MVTAAATTDVPDTKLTESPCFRRLALGNWRNFRSTDVELTERVFLIGPNASGKSNLLDVFRFLGRLSAPGGGLQQAVAERGGMSSLRSLGAPRDADISVEVELETVDGGGLWTYRLVFNEERDQTNGGAVVVREETVRRDGETLLSRPDENDRADPARLSQTHLEQVFANQAFREIAEHFRSIRYLHLIPQLIRDPDRFRERANDPFGSDLLEQIARPPEQELSRRMEQIQQALKVAIPRLELLEIYRDAGGAPHLRARYREARENTWQSERDFSDGTLRLLGLLWALLDGKGPLLLEEPELSLQSRIVREIPQMFAMMQLKNDRQVIVSTHSEELLADEGIRPDEVLLLLPEEPGTAIRKPTDFPVIVDLLRSGMPLAEAVSPYIAAPEPRNLALSVR